MWGRHRPKVLQAPSYGAVWRVGGVYARYGGTCEQGTKNMRGAKGRGG
jgi:hypothetical protein